jgi:hypothetical protein
MSFLDEPTGAVDALRRGLALDPRASGTPLGVAYYRRLLAHSLLRLGRPQEALESLAELTAGSPDKADHETNWLSSRAHLQAGSLTEAVAALSRSGSFRAENPLLPEPSPYLGEARCVPCHSEISKEHARSRHALTFHRGPELLSLPRPERTLVDPDDPRTTHSIESVKDRLEITTRRNGSAWTIVAEYAFGLRDRYFTLVGRDAQKKYRVSRLSYFHHAHESGWTPTFGSDPNLDPIEKMRGETIDVRDGVVRCLYCHVTQSRDFRDPPPESAAGPESADTGIGCERCHGPGGNHVAAMKLHFPDPAIVNAGRAGGDAINKQCADCHTTGVRSQIERAPDDPRYVRSTAVTFAASRCYTESAGSMSCLTCHGGHGERDRSPAFFESICLACHAEPSPESAPAARKDARLNRSVLAPGRACTVNPREGCIGCHMPKIPVPTLRTSLTDHYIRVHPTGARQGAAAN